MLLFTNDSLQFEKTDFNDFESSMKAVETSHPRIFEVGHCFQFGQQKVS